VRVYVRQAALPGLAVGQRGVARLDEGGGTFAGRVTSIAHEAEYTPRVALTEDERADLMFAVRLTLDDSTGRLKAGLPVTVTLATAGDARARVAAAGRRP
jgi:HlyD family secretion protein